MDSTQSKSPKQLAENAAKKLNDLLGLASSSPTLYYTNVKEKEGDFAPAVVISFENKNKEIANKRRVEFLSFFLSKAPALTGKIKLIEEDFFADETCHIYRDTFYIPANDPIIEKIANSTPENINNVLKSNNDSFDSPSSGMMYSNDNNGQSIPSGPAVSEQKNPIDLSEQKNPIDLSEQKNPIDLIGVPNAYKKIMHSNDDVDSVVKRNDSASLAYKLLDNYATTYLFKNRHHREAVKEFLKTHTLNNYFLRDDTNDTIWDSVSSLLFGAKKGPSRGQDLGEYLEKFVEFLAEKNIQMTKNSSLLRRIICLTNIGNASYKNLDNDIVCGGAAPEGHPKPDVKNDFVIAILKKLKSITTPDAYQHAEGILNPSTESKLSDIKNERYVGVTTAAGATKTDKRTPEQREEDSKKTVYKYTPHR